MTTSRPLPQTARLRDLLEVLWTQLESEADSGAGPGSELQTCELHLSTAHGSLQLGRDGDGRRHLLIPVPAAERMEDDRRSLGVHLSSRTLVRGDELPVRYADVSCRRGDLNSTFTGLVVDLCTQIAADPDASGSVLVRTLNSWRLLLGSGVERWTQPRLAGLFAELHTLEALSDEDACAIRLWTGPLGSPQDFRGRRHSIEVKATAASEGRQVRIHGADQLETPEGGTLTLAWFRVSPSTSPDSRSVLDLLDSCRGRCADLQEFETRVRALGLPLEPAGPAGAHRFVINEQRWYDVGDGFPRITPGSFSRGSTPPGVKDLEYTVDLDTVPALAGREAVLARIGGDE